MHQYRLGADLLQSYSVERDLSVHRFSAVAHSEGTNMIHITVPHGEDVPRISISCTLHFHEKLLPLNQIANYWELYSHTTGHLDGLSNSDEEHNIFILEKDHSKNTALFLIPAIS